MFACVCENRKLISAGCFGVWLYAAIIREKYANEYSYMPVNIQETIEQHVKISIF